MKLFTLKRFFVVTLLMCLGVGQVWANGWNAHSTCTLSSSGQGKVYVSNTEIVSDIQYDIQSKAETNTEEANLVPTTHTYYAYAMPDDISVFKGWEDISNLKYPATVDDLASLEAKISIRFTNVPADNPYYTVGNNPEVKFQANFVTKRSVLEEMSKFTEDEIDYLLQSEKVKNAKLVSDLENLKVVTLKDCYAEGEQQPTVDPSIKYDAVIVNRTIIGGYWNTLCLPFDITSAQFEKSGLADAYVWYLDEATKDNNTYNLLFKGVSPNDDIVMHANTPYVVNSATDLSIIGVADATINMSQTCSTTDKNGYVTYTGHYTPFEVENGNYVITKEGFWRVDREANNPFKSNGFRGYFTINDPSGSALSASFDDFDVTGITTVNAADNAKDDNWYNIAGQRVNANTKGIVIKNGKKYFNK